MVAGSCSELMSVNGELPTVQNHTAWVGTGAERGRRVASCSRGGGTRQHKGVRGKERSLAKDESKVSPVLAKKRRRKTARRAQDGRAVMGLQGGWRGGQQRRPGMPVHGV